MTLTHKWMEAGLGRAPFRVITIISVPSAGNIGNNFGAVEAYNMEMAEATQRAKHFGVKLCTCNVCGMGLQNNVIIRDADGKHFVAGIDCAEKSGDSKVMAKAKIEENARKRAIRQAKAEAKRIAANAKLEADQAEQRERNNGLTDWEVIRAAEKAAAEAAETIVAAKSAATAGDIMKVLELTSQHQDDFCASMLRSFRRGDRFSDRAAGIVMEIYGKFHGRRNSKAYGEAYDKAADMLEVYNDSL